MRKETYLKMHYGSKEPMKMKKPSSLMQDMYPQINDRTQPTVSISDAYWVRKDDPGTDLLHHLTFSVYHIFLTLFIGIITFPFIGPFGLLYMVFIGTWLHSLMYIHLKRNQRARICELYHKSRTDKEEQELLDLLYRQKQDFVLRF